MNKIFVRTPKAESEGSKLSTELRRMLTYMEGYLTSDELAKRAPPSLREKWKELINELLDGGFIVAIPEAKIDRRAAKREAPATGVATAIDLNIQKIPVVPVVPEKTKQAEVFPPTVSAKSTQNSETKTEVKQETQMPPNVAQRILNLEIENESLMNLLTEAYVEIEKLKTQLGSNGRTNQPLK